MPPIIAVDTIEYLNDGNIMVVCNDELTARQYLKRNPRCSVIRDEHNGDDRIALIYKSDDCNLLNAVRRA
jgi:hypothetical protein